MEGNERSLSYTGNTQHLREIQHRQSSNGEPLCLSALVASRKERWKGLGSLSVGRDRRVNSEEQRRHIAQKIENSHMGEMDK